MMSLPLWNLTEIFEVGRNNTPGHYRANVLPVLTRRGEMEKIGTAATVFVIAFLAAVGNAAVMSLVTCDRQLRSQVSNLLIANLALVDMLTAVFVMVPSGISVLMDEWPFADILCDLHCGMNYWCVGQTQMTICLLSIDRFISAWRPLHYRSIVTRKKMLIALVFMWCIGSLPAIRPVAEQWVAYDYWELGCHLDWYHYPEVHPWSNGLYGSMFILPSLIIIGSNVYIAIAVRDSASSKKAALRLRRNEGRQRGRGAVARHWRRTASQDLSQLAAAGSLIQWNHSRRTGNLLTAEDAQGGSIELARFSQSTEPVTSSTLSCGNLGCLRRTHCSCASSALTDLDYQSKMNRRIYFSISTVTLCFFLCMSPFSVTKLMKMWTQNINVVPPSACVFSTLLHFSNSFVNPLIYGFLRKDFRRAYYRIRARFEC